MSTVATEFTVKDYVSEINHEAIFYEDMDEAIVGIFDRGSVIVPLYDINRCVAIAMKVFELPYEEAQEHIQFNLVNGWLGENTPAFANLWDSMGMANEEE